MAFNILSVESFYGFLCGILSMDYDLEKIYVDGIYKVMDVNLEKLGKLRDALDKICNKYDVEFYINVHYTMDQIPENLKENCFEIESVEAAY